VKRTLGKLVRHSAGWRPNSRNHAFDDSAEEAARGRQPHLEHLCGRLVIGSGQGMDGVREKELAHPRINSPSNKRRTSNPINLATS
jgi:hypothetical protein